MSRLAGKTALITGAARGIGRAIAERFAAEGAALVLVDIAAIETAGLPPDRLAVVTGDVGEEATLCQAVEAGCDRFRGVDILVNNAYAAIHRPIVDLTADEWRQTLTVSLTAVFYGAKHAIPVMRRQGGGAIVNISSINAYVATPGRPAYTAAKGGLDALTRQLAVEYGPFGIRTNGIRPGLIATPAVAEAILTDADEARAAVESCPLRRVGTPAEIANVTLFLASDEASYVNGIILNVDGGTSVQWPPILTRPGLRRGYIDL